MSYENVDRYVICGDTIPEGGMVCINCIHKWEDGIVRRLPKFSTVSVYGSNF